ncbi:MAG: aldo/keto reductase [Candidatus Acidiferrales bacterium]|jgi:aryl-alcohol dehydrogenase-like predicted oxidoreductase
MSLTDYTTLGRTGLRISPLCLGTMTFGTEWGFGAEEKPSKEMFDRFIDAGGNFIDSADGYTNGHAEELTGKFVAERNLRDKVVIATKFTFNFAQSGNPNAGGNGRKNIYRALEGSLRRLKTDYVDLYYLHAWDTITPVEEVISTMNHLVHEGKIRYYGLSDTPAWYIARAQTIAENHGWERIAALQLEYALTERNIEREHIPVAQELGIGLCPWSPLAGGFLAGKYKREGDKGKGEGRLGQPGGGLFNRFTDRNWRILDVLLDVAKQAGKPPAQVALNWLVQKPGVTSTILGATKLAQLDDNLASLDFTLPAELYKRLDEASAIDAVHPYNFYTSGMQTRVSGGTNVQAWRPAAVYHGAVVEKKATAAD